MSSRIEILRVASFAVSLAPGAWSTHIPGNKLNDAHSWDNGARIRVAWGTICGKRQVLTTRLENPTNSRTSDRHDSRQRRSNTLPRRSCLRFYKKIQQLHNVAGDEGPEQLLLCWRVE